MMHLFKAYMAVSDEQFVSYIQSKQFGHNDGSAPLTEETLMARALAQYEYSIDNATWDAPSKKDAKIIALAAEISKLKRNKGKQTPADRKSNADKYAWKKIKPMAGETTKVVGANSYNWCKWHNAWTIHDPKVCDLNKNKIPTTGPAAATMPNAPELKLDPGLQALIDEIGSDDDSQD
jgi:hypothetical protein